MKLLLVWLLKVWLVWPLVVLLVLVWPV